MTCSQRKRSPLPAALYALAFFAIAGLAQAQACPYTPAVGSDERKAIMDAVRAPVEAELNQGVRFVAQTFNACDGWAFLEATPEQTSGTPVNWSVSSFSEAVSEGMCDPSVIALLQQQGGTWRVRQLVMCATDVPWVTWPGEFGAPAAIFPHTQ
jgi:hypothetical protein